jgi:hypothetical protein
MAMGRHIDPPEQPMGMAIVETAFARYHNAGLRLPPVPRELVDRTAEQSEWQFGTDSAELTDRAGFLQDARDPQAEAALGFGHVGHGIASWFLCYRLILGPLAVFVHHSYGDAYGDDEASRRIFNRAVEQIEELIVMADAARRTGRIAPGQRLVVVIDPLGGSGWEVAGDENGWRKSGDPIEDAREFLSGR